MKNHDSDSDEEIDNLATDPIVKMTDPIVKATDHIVQTINRSYCQKRNMIFS